MIVSRLQPDGRWHLACTRCPWHDEALHRAAVKPLSTAHTAEHAAPPPRRVEKPEPVAAPRRQPEPCARCAERGTRGQVFFDGDDWSCLQCGYVPTPKPLPFVRERSGQQGTGRR